MSRTKNSQISSLPKSLKNKLDHLQAYLKSLGSVLVAFSGGVDSTLLLKVALDTLGSEKVLAVTAKSEIHPDYETQEALKLAKDLKVRCQVLETTLLDNLEFVKNPPERCYICKKALFSKFLQLAKDEGFAAVVDGSNYDDLSDYRPGQKALKELGIHSPLMEAKLLKQEIYLLSSFFCLQNAYTPPRACLASRIPYYETITLEKLQKISSAEEVLRSYGIKQFRVRYHGDLARIEVDRKDFKKIIKEAAKIQEAIKKTGFLYVTLDLGGYRTGSLNELLKKP